MPFRRKACVWSLASMGLHMVLCNTKLRNRLSSCLLSTLHSSWNRENFTSMSFRQRRRNGLFRVSWGTCLLLSVLAHLFLLAGSCLVPEEWLAMVLVVVFDYLLLFQLTALKSHFAYQRMANLMPVGKDMQVSNLKRLISQIVLVLTLVQAICLFDLKFSLILVGIMLVLSLVYLPAKLKKMID